MAAKRSVKAKEHENLSDANVRKVIHLLESSPPITKKEACAILNIAYNTTRLNKIIEQHKDQQELAKRMRAKKRGTPADKDEIKWIIQSFIRGESVTDIAKKNYRSVAFINHLIDSLGVPERAKGDNAHKVALLPDNCMGDSFLDGEIAWSAKYHAPCKVVKELAADTKYAASCYRIWVFERSEETFNQGGFYAAQLAYDLGKLTHLNEYGIDATNL